MSLRLRQLYLVVETKDGRYGTKIIFDEGLVIVRAENSMGKSTCLQAVIYALGLERMLGPSSDIPLPHVMTRYVEDGTNEIPVIESDVFLEISNHAGEIMTIQRGIMGERDPRLIMTWNGPTLSEPNGNFNQKDYFVRDPGSVTHAAGFHSRLTEFLGWKLPTATRFNGAECPLYLEGIFPLFFIEQKHGWTGIQANLPTFLGIRELGTRALEFVLRLDAATLAEERQRFEQDETSLRTRWKNSLVSLNSDLQQTGGKVIGIPDAPTSQWPRVVEPQIEIFREGKWLNIEAAVGADREALHALQVGPVPTAGDLAPQLTTQLEETRRSLNEKEVIAGELINDIENEQMQITAIDTRLFALREDLQQNQDALKLKRFGSIATWSVAEHSCPTCHQTITDALLPQGTVEKAMSIEDNITFIQCQIKSFEKLRENSIQINTTKTSELLIFRNEIDSLRTKIRSIRQTLISADSGPSIETVRQQIELDGRIRLFEKASENFEGWLSTFAEISAKWKELQAMKLALRTDGFSTEDKKKLARFEIIIREQLKEFGFSSINPDSLELSQFNYKPTREGFNLGFDLSASDNIRIIWAFLQGLLELAREFQLNHPDLLIFDEPKQQEAAEMSFVSLLRRATTSRKNNQQVIFFTSEPLENLKEMTKDLAVSINSFEGRVIRRI